MKKSYCQCWRGTFAETLRQSARRSGNQSWARSSRWRTSEERHLMIFYALHTRCESCSAFFAAVARYGHSPRSCWLAEVWMSVSRLRASGLREQPGFIVSKLWMQAKLLCGLNLMKCSHFHNHHTPSTGCFIWLALCCRYAKCSIMFDITISSLNPAATHATDLI